MFRLQLVRCLFVTGSARMVPLLNRRQLAIGVVLLLSPVPGC